MTELHSYYVLKDENLTDDNITTIVLPHLLVEITELFILFNVYFNKTLLSSAIYCNTRLNDHPQSLLHYNNDLFTVVFLFVSSIICLNVVTVGESVHKYIIVWLVTLHYWDQIFWARLGKLIYFFLLVSKVNITQN